MEYKALCLNKNDLYSKWLQDWIDVKQIFIYFIMYILRTKNLYILFCSFQVGKQIAQQLNSRKWGFGQWYCSVTGYKCREDRVWMGHQVVSNVASVSTLIVHSYYFSCFINDVNSSFIFCLLFCIFVCPTVCSLLRLVQPCKHVAAATAQLCSQNFFPQKPFKS